MERKRAFVAGGGTYRTSNLLHSSGIIFVMTRRMLPVATRRRYDVRLVALRQLQRKLQQHSADLGLCVRLDIE